MQAFQKIFFSIATIFTFILSNYLSGIFAVFQYNLKPWSQDVNITTFQFSHYFIALMTGQIAAEHQFNAFKIHGLSFLAALTLLLFLGFIAYLIFSSFKQQGANAGVKNMLGDAKFAKLSDIQAQKLIKPQENKPSILLGIFSKDFLEFNHTKFVALAAPTRAGKGVGVVIPNLLHWNSSVVCLDIKGENFDKTSGYRSGFSQIYKFDPFSLNTHAYNPLTYINRNGVSTISDIQTIARILWPANDADPIWHDSACNLFQGLVLYLLDMELHQKQTTASLVNLYAVFTIAGQIGSYDAQTWRKMQERLPFQISPRTASSLNNYFTLPQETRTSVLGTFNAQMQMFSNPTVIAATSGDDFNLKNIRKKKISIYVCVAPNRLSQASKLLNIFFSQLIQLNSDELPEQNPELKETALILLDEFTALGKVEIIEKAISYIAGYNLRLLLIYQSQSQLSSVYGEESAKNIITNCGCQILFAPREQKDAEEYSQMLGKTTIQIQNHSYNQGGRDAAGRNISINQQERALMLPQELKQMGATTSIIILEDCPPIKAQKIRYYENPSFMKRLLPKVSITEQVLKPEWLGVVVKGESDAGHEEKKRLTYEIQALEEELGESTVNTLSDLGIG